MSREAFERGDWQAVIEAHPLESHDPQEWLRYGVALLQTIQPGPDVGKQQQQAALAFVQAQKEGASAEQVAAAQRQSVLFSLREAMALAGIAAPAELQQPDSGTRKQPIEATGDPTITDIKAGEGQQGESLPYHYRTAIPLRFSFLEHREGQVILQSTHGYGYFSCLSTMLWDLITCANYGKYPALIESTHGMQLFKDCQGVDLFGQHFKAPSRDALSCLPLNQNLLIPPHHGLYSSLNYEALSRFVGAYFRPEDAIEDLVSGFALKYKFDCGNLLVIYYRGTDKGDEVELVPAANYLIEARSILEKESGLRVMVQTDQRQVRDYLLYELGDLAFALDELPVTDGKVGIHNRIDHDKQECAATLLAAVLVMARSRWLVTGTGNVSFWSVLFRGSAERVVQFGALADP